MKLATTHGIRFFVGRSAWIQVLVVVGILLVFGCADVSEDKQFAAGCSESSESVPENEYVAPAPAPTITYWTKQIGSSGRDSVEHMTIDSSGNIYVVGSTTGQFDNNTGNGVEDIFLVKFNNQGTWQWTKQLGTSSQDYANGITTDSNGNVYVTGATGGALDSNVHQGSYDMFLIKYDSNGNKEWTKQHGTSESDGGWGVIADLNDNIYVTGNTAGGLDNNTSAESLDLFIIKYDSNGNKEWTKQIPDTIRPTKYIRDIKTDTSGNIYLTGWEAGADWWDVGLFLHKYDSVGNKIWDDSINESYGYDIDIDLNGNIFITGRADCCVTDHHGWEDAFVVKYDSSGNQLWTRAIGTSDQNQGRGVTTDSNGNVYMTGFSTDNSKGENLDGNVHNGSWDAFIVKYDPAGTKLWTRLIGTATSDQGMSIVFYSNNIYIAGHTSGSLDGNTNVGDSDIFVVKYDTDGNKQ